jgi:hypothetical protein
MANPTTTIELPRLPDESTKAYQARVEYVTMGPQRSQEAVSQRLGKSRQLMYRWATRYDWSKYARQYDEQISYITVQEAADAYRSDLADYRKRYGDMGKSLFTAAGQMVNLINKRLKNGDMELGPGSLTLAVNAAKTAADLEALALRVEHLLNNEPSSE